MSPSGSATCERTREGVCTFSRTVFGRACCASYARDLLGSPCVRPPREFDQVSLPPSLKDQLRLPVIGAPMFIVSTPQLVIAQCSAGIVGGVPALNARSPAQLDEWLDEIGTALDRERRRRPDAKIAPFAVNQIVHATNDRLQRDVELCVRHRVPIIITSLRPPAEVVTAVHGYGGVVFHDVINVRHARKAAEQGVDGIIAVCAGAGGHAGTLSPFALTKEIREFFNGTLILSGAITSGGDVLAAQAIGADLAYIGTRFIAVQEANASEEYKQMVVASAAEDIVYTSLFSGVQGNYLKASAARTGLDPDNLPEADKNKMNFGSGGNTELKAWRDIWSAGQGVGTIHDVPTVAELVDRMVREYREAAARIWAPSPPARGERVG
jgi:nitronate monooxygenase